MAQITCRVSGYDLTSAEPTKKVSQTFKIDDWRKIKPYAKTLEAPKETWYVRVRLTGGDRVNRHFASRDDAVNYERSIETDKRRGVALDPRSGTIPFRTFATEWLDSDPSKRASSKARDKGIVNGYLIPHFGSRPVNAITHDDVQKLVSKWSKILAPSTVGRQFTTLQAIMSAAVRGKRIAETPCEGVRLPEHSPRRSLIIDPATVAQLALKVGEACTPMVYIGAVLGLRWGEVAALRVGDVNLNLGILAVARQRTRGEHGEMIEGEPKSKAGIRTLAMPPELVTLLQKHLAFRGVSEDDSNAYLFAGSKGAPLHYSNWRKRVWEPACETVGIKGFQFRDLRHVNATALALAGVDVKTAQVRLGHSSPSVTLAIYTQVTSESDRRAATAVGGHFFPVTKSRPKIIAVSKGRSAKKGH